VLVHVWYMAERFTMLTLRGGRLGSGDLDRVLDPLGNRGGSHRRRLAAGLRRRQRGDPIPPAPLLTWRRTGGARTTRHDRPASSAATRVAAPANATMIQNRQRSRSSAGVRSVSVIGPPTLSRFALLSTSSGRCDDDGEG
jgi:hypothetical protein